MEIYVACIHHQHGVNQYASKTLMGMTKQVADYCRERWGEYIEAPIPDNDDEVITEYFDYHAQLGFTEWFEGGGGVELAD